MKSIEQLKDEYALFEVRQDLEYSFEAVLVCIKQSIYNLEKNKKDILKTIRANKRRKFLDRFTFATNLDDYEQDIAILREELDLGAIYRYYFVTLAGIVNEDNKKDIYKLLNFTINNYNANLACLEEKRDILEYQQNGISYMGKELADESVVSFVDFFKEILQSVEGKENLCLEKKYQH